MWICEHCQKIYLPTILIAISITIFQFVFVGRENEYVENEQSTISFHLVIDGKHQQKWEMWVTFRALREASLTLQKLSNYFTPEMRFGTRAYS